MRPRLSSRELETEFTRRWGRRPGPRGRRPIRCSWRTVRDVPEGPRQRPEVLGNTEGPVIRWSREGRGESAAQTDLTRGLNIWNILEGKQNKTQNTKRTPFPSNLSRQDGPSRGHLSRSGCEGDCCPPVLSQGHRGRLSFLEHEHSKSHLLPTCP